MQEIKKGTKLYNTIFNDYMYKNLGGILEAYKKPCTKNIKAYYEIEKTAKNNAGYNNDLKVVCASSHIFCTIYSYIQDNITYIVKNTPKNCYIIAV